ncbi:STAS domain-containing protein [Dactylosporangium darangshiense]|uniref:STAS domain-containing protein n=1 Tax=Dactylosporangium darangshiense TaxID=579108 RepID=A0ABP8D7Y0_9ACTN
MMPFEVRSGWITVRPGSAPDQVLHLVAGGRLDRLDRTRFLDALTAAVTTGRSAVELDVERVTLVDVAVVRILLEARRIAAAHGCVFRLIRPVGRFALILDLTGTRAKLCEPGPVSRRPRVSGALEAGPRPEAPQPPPITSAPP